jgi:hypothetical protein
MRRFVRCALLASGLVVPVALRAQEWKPIGTTTRDTTQVFVKSATVKRGGDTVSAQLLMRFPSPQTKDRLRAMTKSLVFNCKTEQMLVRETVTYTDFDRKRGMNRTVSKIPGWGAVFSPAYVMAYANLCSTSK